MNRSTWSLARIVLGALILLGWASALVVGAAEPAESESRQSPHSQAANATNAANVRGVTVYIDERTGRMRTPTSEEARELRSAMQRMFASTGPSPKTITPQRDGTISLVLDQSYAVFSIAVIDDDGRLSTRCVSGTANAETVLSQGATSHEREEE